MNQLIAGKSLQEWVNAPEGEFTKAVRAKIDPHWGRSPNELKKYRVKVYGELSKERSDTYDIEGYIGANEAEERAESMFRQDHDDDWDNVSAKATEVE
jgi:hypothetical protein